MLNEHWVIVGVLIGLLADGQYAVQAVRGRTRPNRVSWTLWAFAPLVAFAAELHQQVGLQSLMTFSVGFGPLLVVIASLFTRAEKWHLTSFDYACGALSLLALVVWAITKQGDLAIALSILGDLAAGIPTLKKSFTRPETESWWVFGFGIINAGITLLTIRVWNFANAGFPVYIFAFCIVAAALIKFEPAKKIRKEVAT